MHVLTASCPACGGLDLRRSRTKLRDWFFLALAFRPLRCMECDWRFYSRRPPEEAEPSTPGILVANTQMDLIIRIRRPSRLTRAIVSLLASR